MEKSSAREPDKLVSVVVPVFNVDRYLRQCVNSILTQTYKRLQVILIDDGSTDESGSVCDSFASYDDRVHVIHQPNAGLAAARNAGIAVSRGSWLFFVDSDDWIHQDAIRLLLATATNGAGDVVVGSFQRFDEGQDLVEPATATAETLVLESGEGLTALMGDAHTLLTVAWGKLIRRSLFSNLEFPVGCLHEDEFVSHRLLHAAHRVIVLHRSLYFYRQHSGSIMAAGFNTKKAMDAIDAYADRLNFLHEVGRTDLLPLARAQLFRKYVALFRGTSQGSRSDAVLSQMRILAREMRASRDRSAFVAFASAYAWWPHLIDPLYSAHNRRSTRARPGRLSE